MLKEFTIHPQQQWNNTSPWGGGHTIETDPTRKGWKMRANSVHCAVVGQPGKPGCASVMRMGDNQLDVALYEETPNEVSEQLKTGFVDAVMYVAAPNCPGWALTIIDLIEEVRARMAAIEERE